MLKSLVPKPFDNSAESYLEHARAIASIFHSDELLWLAPFPPPHTLANLQAAKAVLVLPTSGSTGSAKAVAHTRESLLAAIEKTNRYLNHSPKARGIWFLFLPPTHIAGVQVVLRAVSSAKALGESTNLQLFRDDLPLTLALPSYTGSFNAASFKENFYRQLNTIKAQNNQIQEILMAQPLYTALVPTQLGRLLDSVKAGDQELLEILQSFRTILVGGAKISSELLNSAKAAAINLTLTYGSSETGGGVVYNARALAGVKMRLNPQGELELKTSSLAAGYVYPSGHLEDLRENGWFKTSDLAQITTDQHGLELRILGRSDAVINSGGRKINPLEVEELLEQLPEVQAAVVIGLADETWGEKVAAMIQVSPANISSQLNQNLRSKLKELTTNSYLIPKVLHPVTQLPLLSNQKVDLKQVLAMLKALENSSLKD